MTPTTVKLCPFQLYGPADHRRIGGEAALPQAMAEDRDVDAAVGVFAQGEVAAELRTNAERGKQIGGSAGVRTE